MTLRIIAAHIAERLDVLKLSRPALVAIDGGGGAGKSTLAAKLAPLTGAAIVAGDDFYRVMSPAEREALDPQAAYNRNFDWQRLRDQVLIPIRSGQRARYQRYDWCQNTLRQEWIEIEPSRFILVEGVYTYRPELSDLYDFAIYVESPLEVRLDRMRARPANPEELIQRWAAAELWYARNALQLDRFDLIVSGDQPQ